MTAIGIARHARMPILLLCMCGYFVGETVWVSCYVGFSGQLGAPDLGVATPPGHALIFIAVTLALAALLVAAIFAPRGRKGRGSSVT